ncbi:SprT family protein [Carnobacterium divergens]|uniref:SprT family protein n=1 Tax=Carnobacterium divergens TaxID=2748 RepID=UPI000E74607A|nr:SprT family protein [Carnobacterium divergens]AOA00593.1 SprT family protein [Carnobacterium divergens]
MNQKELQLLVESISINDFQRPFNHQATFNSRLKTTGGRYHLNTHHLDFNLKVLETFGMEEFIGVVKHELCHYHLHLSGGGYQHKDADFKRLLKQVGGSRYVQSLKPKDQKQAYWVYQCQQCKNSLYRKRSFNTARYVCGQCKGKLVLKGERVEM